MSAASCTECFRESVVNFCAKPQLYERIDAIPEIVQESLRLIGGLLLMVPCGGWRWAVSKDLSEHPFLERLRDVKCCARNVFAGLVTILAPETGTSWTESHVHPSPIEHGTIAELCFTQGVRMIALRIRVITNIAYHSLHFVGSMFMAGLAMGKWVVQLSSLAYAKRERIRYLGHAGLAVLAVVSGVVCGWLMPEVINECMKKMRD